MTEIVVDFSRAVNAAEAKKTATYSLTTAGSRNSFVARNAVKQKLRSATIDAALDEVTLTLRTALPLAKPTQLVIHGGLQDSTGGLVDGGANGVFVITRKSIARG